MFRVPSQEVKAHRPDHGDRGEIGPVHLGYHGVQAERPVMSPVGQHPDHRGGHSPTTLRSRGPPANPGRSSPAVKGPEPDLTEDPTVVGRRGHQVKGQAIVPPLITTGDPA